MVQLFTPYHKAEGKAGGGASGGKNSEAGMHLYATVFPWDTEENFEYRRRMERGEDVIKCLKADFLPELDLICVLSSDMRMNFHKVLNKNSVSSESVKPAGRVQTDTQQYILAWDGEHRNLFTAGCDSEITVWQVSEVKQSEKQRG